MLPPGYSSPIIGLSCDGSRVALVVALATVSAPCARPGDPFNRVLSHYVAGFRVGVRISRRLGQAKRLMRRSARLCHHGRNLARVV